MRLRDADKLNLDDEVILKDTGQPAKIVNISYGKKAVYFEVINEWNELLVKSHLEVLEVK